MWLRRYLGRGWCPRRRNNYENIVK
jgi:hypothetical protein